MSLFFYIILYKKFLLKTFCSNWFDSLFIKINDNPGIPPIMFVLSVDHLMCDFCPRFKKKKIINK